MADAREMYGSRLYVVEHCIRNHDFDWISK